MQDQLADQWENHRRQMIQKKKNENTVREVKAMIQVGKKAPDFIAPAYQDGKFFSIQLSEYLGRWVVLCFYPGDFTFV